MVFKGRVSAEKPGAIALLAFAAIFAPAAEAASQTFVGEYTVTFLGLPVARSTFSSTIDGDNYHVSGKVQSAGVGKLVDSVNGSSEVSGSFSGKATQSRNFSTEYRNGRKKQLTTIAFAGGAVTNTVNQPALKQRPDKVPLLAEHLRGVTDPISATLVKADSVANVCGRTLAIYDGELRADLSLAPGKVGKTAGVEGDTITCSAKFTPVAGYRTGNYAMKYMRNKARISITFAPLGETGIYAPVRATVSTTMGPVTLVGKPVKK